MRLFPVILGIVVSMTSCLVGVGDDYPVQYVSSPDGRYEAVVMKAPGGVTVRPYRYLKVLRSTEQIDDRASPLAIRTPYYVTPSDARSIARIDIQWASNDSLIASIDSRAEIMAGGGDFGNGLRISTGVPDDVRLVVRTRYESALPP